MKKLLIMLAVLIVTGVCYVGFYPPSIMKRTASQAIEQFNAAAATKDRAQVGAVLQKLIADGAKIHLEVNFLSLTSQTKPIMQDFPDKQSFITFIDNVLYPLTDFEYTARMDAFRASDDRKTADVTFSSFEYGDGQSLYGGTGVDMRYSSNSSCTAKAVYADAEHAALSELSCSVQMRMVPKPGQAQKFQNMDSLNDLLKQQQR